MTKPRMRRWVAWYSNRTSIKDDEPHVIEARTREEARELALDRMDRSRFGLEGVYTLTECFKRFGYHWRGLL